MASGLRLKLRSRIGKDGVLELHAPTPLPEGEVEVDLWVQPIESEAALPPGTPGSALLDLAGTLPAPLAEQMLEAIEEDYERVKPYVK
ncbi:MAG: hypothetical protein N2045_14010 [Fimbriimonadales bacterium]|nr:hypothetical protein [Fimbriimonadales bacterium]